MKRGWTMRRAALWLSLLAGCGRLGFDAAATATADGAAADFTRVVLNRPTQTGTQSAPVAGAIVVVDRGAADVERLVTDELGSALFPSAGVVAFHVIDYRGPGSPWRIYTIAVPTTGTIELGGRQFFNARNQMTLALPSDAGATSYYVIESGRCIQGLSGTASALPIKYRPECEGTVVHMVAYAARPGLTHYFDAGPITLRNGSTLPISGSYLTATSQKINVEHLPDGTTSAYAALYARSGDQLTARSSISDAVIPQGNAAALIANASIGGDVVYLRADGSPGGPRLARSERVAPISLAGAPPVDGTGMLPLFDSLVVPDDGTMTWTGGGTRGTVISTYRSDLSNVWRAFLPPTATSLAFPALPADLGVTPPGFAFTGLITKVEVSGAAPGELIQALDLEQDDWPHAPGLVSAAGGVISRIIYDTGPGFRQRALDESQP